MTMRMIQLNLIDPNPLQPKERDDVIESVKEMGVLEPIVVRPKGSRFEVISGHRRLATLKAMHKQAALCKVIHVDSNLKATMMLFRSEEDHKSWNDVQRAKFFIDFMKEYRLNETEAGKALGVSQPTISLCVGLAKVAERVITPGITNAASLEEILTTHRVSFVEALPEEVRNEVYRKLAEEHLSTDETRELVVRVQAGKTVEQAAVEVVNLRETRKVERYAQRKRRETCPTCQGRGWILKSESHE